MRILDLANLDAQVSVTVTVADLREFFNELVADYTEQKLRDKEDKYLTVEETCRTLKVSYNTLWRWDKIKYLCSVKVGRTPMYKESDVDDILLGKKAKPRKLS